MFLNPFSAKSHQQVPKKDTATEEDQIASDQKMTDASIELVEKESDAVDTKGSGLAATEVPATPEIHEQRVTKAQDKVQAAIDKKSRLSPEAGKAQKAMLRIGNEFDKFRDILLSIQKTERKYGVELKELDSGIQSQQALIRNHAEQTGSTDDHEVDCVAIDTANVKIRELQMTKTEVRVRLQQSKVDREELEALLSSHNNKVSDTTAKVQDWMEGQREQKRHKSGTLKRDALGSVKAPMSGTDIIASSSSNRPAISRTSSGNVGGVVARDHGLSRPPLVRHSSSSDVVPSSSRSSSLSAASGSDIL